MAPWLLDSRLRGNDDLNLTSCLPGGGALLLFRFPLRRDHRQQDVGRPAAAEMQGRGPGEDFRGAVDRIVVQERPAARELVLEVGQPPAARTAILVVLAADRERDAMAGRHDDRGRPDLDVELDHLALPEGLLAV